MSLTLVVAVAVAAAAATGADEAAAPASAAASGPALSDLQTRGAQAINTARAMVQARKPLEAVVVLDPVLAEYGRDHVVRRVVTGTAKRAEDAVYVAGESGRRVYGTRSPAETLAYMLLAATHGESAVAFDPLWGNALELKGYALIELRRWQEAEEALRTAVALSPMNTGYLIELGNLYTLQRRWDEATRLLDAAIAHANLSPEPARLADQTHAWRARAYVDVELGRLDEAEALYRKCLEADPNDAKAAGELQYIARQRSLKPAPR